MPSNSKPPLVRRGFVIVLSLTLLSGYVGFTAMQRVRRPIRSTKSTQVLQDLRMIDAAIDQYAIEYNKSGGSTATWEDVQIYLKTGTRLESPEQAIRGITEQDSNPNAANSLVPLLTFHPAPEVGGVVGITYRPNPVLASGSKSSIVLSQDDMRAIQRSELFQRITNPQVMPSTKSGTVFMPGRIIAEPESDELTSILNNPLNAPARQSPSK